MSKILQYLAFAIGILTIVASGGGGDDKSDTTPAPELNTAPLYNSPTSFNLSENNDFSQALSASDTDGDVLTFSLMSEGDSQFFSVTGVGVLTSTSQFDYETPDDTNSDNVYELTLRVTDNTDPVLIPLTINVQNVGPVFSSPTEFSVAENELFFAKLSAVDSNGNPVDVTISNPDDISLFTYDEPTGQLTTQTTFDFESPQDSNRDNVYDFVVSASDGVEVTQFDATITVQDKTGINRLSVLPGGSISIFADESSTKTALVQGPDGADTVIYSLLDGPSWVAIDDEGVIVADPSNGNVQSGTYTATISADDTSDIEEPARKILTIEVLDEITLVSGMLGPEGGKLENSWRDFIIEAEPNELTQEYEISYSGALNAAGDVIFKLKTSPVLAEIDEDKITLTEPSAEIISLNYFSPVSDTESQKVNKTAFQKQLSDTEIKTLVHPSAAHKKSCLTDWKDVSVDGHSFDYIWQATRDDFSDNLKELNGQPRIWGELSKLQKILVDPEYSCASTLRSSMKWTDPKISTHEPVIFVHGFIPDGELGGFNENEEYFGKFPGIVRNAEIDGRNFAPYLFSWRTNANYLQVAEDLAFAIETLNARTGQRVHIVAHSYGGVLSRTLIQGLSDGLDKEDAEDRIASLTTVGTPHSGIFEDPLGFGDTQTVTIGADSIDFPVGRDAVFGKLIDGYLIKGCSAITCHQTGEGWRFASFYPTLFGLSGDDAKIGAISHGLANSIESYPNVPTLSLMGVFSTSSTVTCSEDGECSIAPRFWPSSMGDGLISLEGQRFKPDLRFNDIYEKGSQIKERILDLEVVDASSLGLSGANYTTFPEYGDGLLRELSSFAFLEAFDYKYESANSYPWNDEFVNGTLPNSFGGIGHTAGSGDLKEREFASPSGDSKNGVKLQTLTEVGLNNCDRTDVVNCNHPTWLYFRDHLRENIAGSYNHQTAEINASISVTQNGATPNVPYTVVFSADGKEVGAEAFPVGTSTASLSIPFNSEADYTAKVIPDNGTQTQVSAKLSQSKTFIPGFLRSIVSVVLTTEGTVDESELVFPNVELVEALEEAPMGEIDFSVIDAVSNNPVSNFTIKVFNTLNKDELETLDVAGETATLNFPIGHYQVAVSKVGYNPNRPFTCSVLETQNNVCEISIEKNIDELLRTLSIERVSVSSTGNQSDGHSESGDISADGRFVVFSSEASNLVNEDTNDVRDIFIHDRNNKTTTRISASADGAQGNRASYRPRISADGRYVSFLSNAINLVEEVTTDAKKVYVYELSTGAVELVSVPNDGAQPNHQSVEADISSDGRYVAFTSEASNLVDGDTNNLFDIFLHDRSTSTTERISVSSNGAQFTGQSSNPKIYGNGRFIVYRVRNSNMTEYYIYDSTFRTTERLPSAISAPRLSSDGRYVAFSSEASNLVDGDTNNLSDIFVYDRSLDIYKRISVTNNGTEVNGASFGALFSEDSGYIFFSSRASNLVENDTNDRRDVFVYDQNNGIIERIVVNGNNSQQGYDDAWVSSTSANGRFVVIESSAANVVSNDTNDHRDIFVATLE